MRLFPLLLASWAACAPAEAPRWEEKRNAMVDQLANYSPDYKVADPRVLAAMRKVPRHELVPEAVRAHAYADTPLPIGEGQTISQPFMVGIMTELLRLEGGERVLEIGTGSGYQAAVLAEIVKEVDTIEIVEPLARRAEKDLARLGYETIRVRAGDGYGGWKERAPYDAVMVTCGAEKVPPALVEQLKPGGRMVIPVGPDPDKKPGTHQRLLVVTKTAKGTTTEKLFPVRFVPMTGEARKP